MHNIAAGKHTNFDAVAAAPIKCSVLVLSIMFAFAANGVSRQKEEKNVAKGNTIAARQDRTKTTGANSIYP